MILNIWPHTVERPLSHKHESSIPLLKVTTHRSGTSKGYQPHGIPQRGWDPTQNLINTFIVSDSLHLCSRTHLLLKTLFLQRAKEKTQRHLYQITQCPTAPSFKMAGPHIWVTIFESEEFQLPTHKALLRSYLQQKFKWRKKSYICHSWVHVQTHPKGQKFERFPHLGPPELSFKEY